MSKKKDSLDWLYNLPRVPLIFAGVVFAGLLYSLTGQIETPVLRAPPVTLQHGQPVKFAPMKLVPELNYSLKMSQLSQRKQLYSWASIGATLTHMESEEEIFELSDDYWAETGVWHEDGESGTWEEQNADTRFDFRVAEPGNYRLEVVLAEHDARPVVEFGAEVVSRKATLLHWAVMLGGLVLLLGLALTAYSRRRATLFKYMEDALHIGGTIQVQGVRYTVIERWLHQDDEGGKPGYEWRLRADNGAERYLALETYEYESGDEDYQGRYLLIDCPDEEIEGASGGFAQTVRVGGRTYSYDTENSGQAVMVTYRDGKAYESRYFARVFQGGDGDCPPPTRHGVRMVEFTQFVDSGEEEWSVMEILDWQDIEELEVGPAPAAQAAT